MVRWLSSQTDRLCEPLWTACYKISSAWESVEIKETYIFNDNDHRHIYSFHLLMFMKNYIGLF